MSENALHRIAVPGPAVTAVRTRIESKLGVTTSTRREGCKWAIYFESPPNVDLEFLRPDVLPPLQSGGVTCE